MRHTESYKDRCLVAVGLEAGKEDKERYAHITNPADFDLLRWAVRRGSGSMWVPDSPRTAVRGFLHRLITKGQPVRVGLFRQSR
eukprot:3058450-Alexandrium_andersonii.AAC.1